MLEELFKEDGLNIYFRYGDFFLYFIKPEWFVVELNIPFKDAVYRGESLDDAVKILKEKVNGN